LTLNENKIDGEVKDLRQGSAFHQRVRIEGSSDYKVTAGSHLIIVTAGAAQKPGMSRLSLVEINGTFYIFDLCIVVLLHLHCCVAVHTS
jgi:malate/lactate dehydrogenase